MKKMEIKHKTIQNFDNYDGEETMCSLAVLASSLSDNKISFTLKNETYKIELDSKDILKLMTWLVGQEKHKDEEKRHERKIQKIAEDLHGEFIKNTPKIKENQKIRDTLVKLYKQYVDSLPSAFGEYTGEGTLKQVKSDISLLSWIYSVATRKDIKDL